MENEPKEIFNLIENFQHLVFLEIKYDKLLALVRYAVTFQVTPKTHFLVKIFIDLEVWVKREIIPYFCRQITLEWRSRCSFAASISATALQKRRGREVTCNTVHYRFSKPSINIGRLGKCIGKLRSPLSQKAIHKSLRRSELSLDQLLDQKASSFSRYWGVGIYSRDHCTSPPVIKDLLLGAGPVFIVILSSYHSYTFLKISSQYFVH